MMRPSLEPRIMKRLAFIRALYMQGVRQSSQPEPWASASILSFQDAVELFLVLSAEHLGESLRDTVPFNEYFPKVEAALPSEAGRLAEKRSMQRLNKVRVNLKHHGHFPGGGELEQAREDTAAFFEKNTPIVFGIEFRDVDLLALVPQNEIRELLEEASRATEESELASAMIILARAFHQLLTSHLSLPSLFFGDRIKFSRPVWEIEEVSGKPWLENLVQQVSNLEFKLDTMQRGLQVVSLGLDYSEYARFRQLTPDLLFFPDGQYITFTKEYSPPSKVDFDYCRDFIIATAIRIGQLSGQAR